MRRASLLLEHDGADLGQVCVHGAHHLAVAFRRRLNAEGQQQCVRRRARVTTFA